MEGGGGGAAGTLPELCRQTAGIKTQLYKKLKYPMLFLGKNVLYLARFCTEGNLMEKKYVNGREKRFDLNFSLKNIFTEDVDLFFV